MRCGRGGDRLGGGQEELGGSPSMSALRPAASSSSSVRRRGVADTPPLGRHRPEKFFFIWADGWSRRRGVVDLPPLGRLCSPLLCGHHPVPWQGTCERAGPDGDSIQKSLCGRPPPFRLQPAARFNPGDMIGHLHRALLLAPPHTAAKMSGNNASALTCKTGNQRRGCDGLLMWCQS